MLFLSSFRNYGHDNVSIRLLGDTTPQVENQLMIFFLGVEWICIFLQFYHLLLLLSLLTYFKWNISNISLFNWVKCCQKQA